MGIVWKYNCGPCKLILKSEIQVFDLSVIDADINVIDENLI